MALKACVELFNERSSEMRNMKRVLIIFAIVEFIVLAVGMFSYVKN